MGEYYRIVNSDKGQCLVCNSLGMSVKLDGVIASPLPAILVWLLADGAPSAGTVAMRGSWAGDRIIVARDEGESASIWERAHIEYRDITVEAFETLAADSSYIGLAYEERGILDEEGKFVADWASRLRPIGEEDADR